MNSDYRMVLVVDLYPLTRPSNFAQGLRAVDTQQVSGISRRSDSQRSQERQIRTQARVAGGCTAGEPFFRTGVLSPNASFDQAISSVHVDVVPCQGQRPQPLALALWEEPKPLATRDRDAFQTPNEPFGNLMTMEEPPECVLNLVRKVIGLGIATSPKGENKGHYPILDDFIEICEDSMLIHHGEMMAIILHEFVPSTKALEHVRTLGDLFRYDGTILHSCSRESRMALFRHKFCRGDLIVDRSPRHEIVILFQSAWLQHCTMPIRGHGRQLGCALYLRKQTMSQYVARQANLSRINRALNESMRTKNSTRRQGKRKMGPLQGALRVTYSGNTIDVYEEA
ncbi:unnamed protein product [Sphagnum jensenii]